MSAPLVTGWLRLSYKARTEDLTDAKAADALNLPEGYIGRILGLTPTARKAAKRQRTGRVKRWQDGAMV